MPLFRRILFAADFSERSRRAFRAACSIADETKTRLSVLHVVDKTGADDRVAAPVVGPGPGREGDWVFDDDVEGLLRELYAPARAVDVEYLVRKGGAAEAILRTAGEVGADLIALGTQGRTGLPRLLFGSVAEAVLRHARCPVMALHGPDDAPVGSPRVILHPTDYSEESETALAVARALARDHGAGLVVAHVVPFEIVVETVMLPLVTPADHKRFDEVRERTDGPDLKYPVETRMMRGDVAPAILRAAAETGADLIVMGTHGRGGIGRLLLGSVAEAVLREAHCPVLAVKSGTPAAGTPVEEGAASLTHQAQNI